MKAILLGCSLSFALCACSSLFDYAKAKAAEAKIKTPNGGKVSQTGFAAEPAEVSSANSVTSLPIPKGSTVTVEAASASSPEKISVVVSADTNLTNTTKSDQAKGPKSYVPDKGPTALEQAQAKGVELSYWLAGGLLLLCGGLAYTQHFKAAIIAGVCAVAAPILARFVSSTAGMVVVLVGVCISGTLYAAWYLTKNHPEVLAEAESRLKAAASKLQA